MEGVSVAALIASLGTFVAVVFDKLRNSRCTTISCCGLCSCNRSVVDEPVYEKAPGEPKQRKCSK